MTVVVVVMAAWIVVSVLSGVLWSVLCVRADRRRAAVDRAVYRHPAGQYRFVFWARPCRHKLYSPTLDVLDVEHIELLHTTTCLVAQHLVQEDRDAA